MTVTEFFYFFFCEEYIGSYDAALFVGPFVDFVFYTGSPVKDGLEFEGFDAVQVLLSGLVSVYTGVDVYRLSFGIAADVLDDVVGHFLVSHHGGEDCAVGVWRELLVESFLS